MATPLKKINEIITGLLQTQSFTASLGSATDDAVWAQAAPNIKNGNAVLIQPGPATNQIVIKASAIVMTVPLAGFVKIETTVDDAITSTTSIPPGARNDGTNYFFSEFTTWNETPVLLSNRFNHIYIVYDTTKTNNFAIAVISNNSAADPSPALYSNLGVSVSPRQAMCFVDPTGLVTLLQTYPGFFGTAVSVVADAPTEFANWAGDVATVPTNVITTTFTFPAGTGTGAVGQLAVKLGADIVAYLPISPQLLKDADVPLVFKWNLMAGDPGAFLP
jgi:hypothetical protein